MSPFRTLILVAPFVMGAVANAQFLTPPHDDTNNINCLDCHTIHGDPLYDYTTVDGNINLCKSCHNPAGVGDIETHSPGGVDMMCTTCHNPHAQDQQLLHGSNFSFLIRDQITTPNSGDLSVLLLGPTGPNSFADGDAVYDGVCEVCHTQTNYHRNNPTGDHLHNVASDCRSCHPHTAGFQPTGGACTDCHNSPQPPGVGYRRQVVENNGDGLGDFVRYSHHVNDLTGNESVTDGDCTACHDQSSHQGHPDPQVLLSDPDGGASHQFDGTASSLTGFCLGCHDADGQGGNLAPFTSGGAPVDIEQWWSQSPSHATTPVGIGCWDCHQNGHGSNNPSMAVALEELTCLACHDGSGAGANVAADFNRPYVHPITAQSFVHEPGEDPLNMPRHVECVDCHEPHRADGSAGVPPAASGLLAGVSGIDTDGNVVSEVSNGFELCYKCHADTAVMVPGVPRLYAENNTRNEFDPAQPAFHPIEAAAKNPDVPSLTGGWSPGDIMTCWDCHTGSSSAGPHGSNNPWILRFQYDTGDFVQESPQAYALCYHCHDRNSILNDDSFDDHRKHIEGEDTSCAACHDAHGTTGHVYNASGTHLINFKSSIVAPNRDGELWFRDDGVLAGSCSLDCHGEDHRDETYRK